MILKNQSFVMSKSDFDVWVTTESDFGRNLFSFPNTSTLVPTYVALLVRSASNSYEDDVTPHTEVCHIRNPFLQLLKFVNGYLS